MRLNSVITTDTELLWERKYQGLTALEDLHYITTSITAPNYRTHHDRETNYLSHRNASNSVFSFIFRVSKCPRPPNLLFMNL